MDPITIGIVAIVALVLYSGVLSNPTSVATSQPTSVATSKSTPVSNASVAQANQTAAVAGSISSTGTAIASIIAKNQSSLGSVSTDPQQGSTVNGVLIGQSSMSYMPALNSPDVVAPPNVGNLNLPTSSMPDLGPETVSMPILVGGDNFSTAGDIVTNTGDVRD